MSSPRILFYVQYLLGIGHVRRASLVIQALCQQGAKVDVIFGGMPVSNISFGTATVHQLPAVKSRDADFSGLVKADGSELTEIDKSARVNQLIALCERLQPDLIVTETYPFGRRQMRFELIPLLNWVAAQPRSVVLVSSIRDILQRRSEKREQECLALIDQFYQHVLVHGDERFFPLSKSFPPAREITDKIDYSGYVCPQLESTVETERHTNFEQPGGKIIVSIGGGSVGKEILQAALSLYQSGFANHWQWLLITGPNMADKDKAYFREQTESLANVEATGLADNFLEQLNAADLSISMAGYNTLMDIFITQVPSVVVPFEGSGETEQITRAKELAAKNVVQVVSEAQLDSEHLAQAMKLAIGDKQGKLQIDNQGALNSAKTLIQWAQQSS